MSARQVTGPRHGRCPVTSRRPWPAPAERQTQPAGPGPAAASAGEDASDPQLRGRRRRGRRRLPRGAGRTAAGAGDEAAVVASLATARVFVPILATLAEEGDGVADLHADKQADMALVTLKAPDGRTAMPVFTSAASLAAWHPEARPVAVYAARAALSAVAEGAELLVLDPGSPITFVVRRPAVWALAQQRDWTPSYAIRSWPAALVRPRLAFRRFAGWKFIRAAESPRLRPTDGSFPAAAPARNSGWCCTLKTDSTPPASSPSWPVSTTPGRGMKFLPSGLTRSKSNCSAQHSSRRPARETPGAAEGSTRRNVVS